MKRLTLPNDIETIPQLNEFIDGFCEERGIDFDITMRLNLAIEEAVVNVMSYAYPKGTVGNVDIEVEADEDYITFVIRDSGVPFDPTQKEDPDIDLNPSERQIGGLGIYIVKNIMNEVTYQRLEGKNLLTMTKDIENK